MFQQNSVAGMVTTVVAAPQRPGGGDGRSVFAGVQRDCGAVSVCGGVDVQHVLDQRVRRSSLVTLNPEITMPDLQTFADRLKSHLGTRVAP